MDQDNAEELRIFEQATLLCLGAVLAERGLFLGRMCLYGGPRAMDIVAWVFLAAGVAAAAWMMVRERHNAFRLAAVSGIALSVLVDAAVLLNGILHAPGAWWHLVPLLSSFPLVVLLFLWFRFRRARWGYPARPPKFLTMLGTAVLCHGLVLAALLAMGFSFSQLWLAVIQIAVGAGLLARDKGFGGYGSLFWAALILFQRRYLEDPTLPAKCLHFLELTVFPAALYWVTREWAEFKTNSLDWFAGVMQEVTTSKSCGRCGRSVPLSARAGQRCPYCGAYWGSERTNQITR